MSTAFRNFRGGPADARSVAGNAIAYSRSTASADAGSATRTENEDAGVVAGRLVDVLDRETAALAAADRATIAALALEKRLACRAWEEAAGAVAEGARALDPERRAELRDVIRRLDKSTQENTRRLVAMLAAQQRIIDIITGAARATGAPVEGYGKDGARPTVPAGRMPARSIGFNCAT